MTDAEMRPRASALGSSASSGADSDSGYPAGYTFDDDFQTWSRRADVQRSMSTFRCRHAQGQVALGPSTEQQAIAPFHYTTEAGYDVLNGYLRASSSSESAVIDRYARILNASLERRPSYKGVVWRKVDLKNRDVDRADFLESHQEGNVVRKKAFISSTKREKVARRWPGEVMMVIQSKAGRDIEDISSHALEEEVLFSSGTRFRVDAVEERDGLTWIYMEELP